MPSNLAIFFVSKDRFGTPTRRAQVVASEVHNTHTMFSRFGNPWAEGLQRRETKERSGPFKHFHGPFGISDLMCFSTFDVFNRFFATFRHVRMASGVSQFLERRILSKLWAIAPGTGPAQVKEFSDQ